MTPAKGRESLDRMLRDSGEAVTLQRGSAPSGRTTGAPVGMLLALTVTSGVAGYSARARLTSLGVLNTFASIQQVRYRAVLSAQDVADSGFPLPFRQKVDRVIWRGKPLVIVAVDEASRRINGELIGYELELVGG